MFERGREGREKYTFGKREEKEKQTLVKNVASSNPLFSLSIILAMFGWMGKGRGGSSGRVLLDTG